MSMNLCMHLNGAYLDNLYQTPTDTTYWCLYPKRYYKRNPDADRKRHPVFADKWRSYHCYADWCYKRGFEREYLRYHLADIRKLLEAGAEFCVI